MSTKEVLARQTGANRQVLEIKEELDTRIKELEKMTLMALLMQ